MVCRSSKVCALGAGQSVESSIMLRVETKTAARISFRTAAA
jgi:hypothetical protein